MVRQVQQVTLFPYPPSLFIDIWIKGKHKTDCSEPSTGANGCVARITLDFKDKVEKGLPDARLIAAAPELLEACKEAKRMYDAINPVGGWQGVDDLLIDAIAKAEEMEV